jgi:hypothetical protein
MTNPTLCLPDSGKSCFACCPSIRPAGYEHVQHLNIIKRIVDRAIKRFPDFSGPIKPL